MIRNLLTAKLRICKHVRIIQNYIHRSNSFVYFMQNTPSNNAARIISLRQILKVSGS